MTRPRTSNWTIRKYDGIDGFRALEADWNRLATAIPERGFHHSFETNLAYAMHSAERSRPSFVLALCNGNDVRAICPIELGHARLLARGVPVWGFPLGLGNVVRDLICPPDAEAERELLPRLIEHLRNEQDRHTNWLVFDRVLDRSCLQRCLRALNARSYGMDVVANVDEVDCQRTFAELAAQLPKKFRANLRNATNRLASSGGHEFRRITGVHELPAAFERFLDLEAAGWKGADSVGYAMRKQPTLVAFYSDLIQSLHADAQCEFNELHIDGRLAASLFCIRAGGEYAIMKTCYDEELARFSPGALLLDSTLAWCCADPTIHRMNLVSHQEWLRRWHPASLPCHAVYIRLDRVTGPLWTWLLRMRFRHGDQLKRLLKRK